MTYDEFIKKHNGVAINYDGAAGKQCVDFSPHTQGYTISKKSGAFKAPLFSKYTAKTYFIPFTLYPASVTALESTSSATSLSSVM